MITSRQDFKTLSSELASTSGSNKQHRVARVAQPSVVNLMSKPSTQKDLDSEWVGYWCHRLGIARVYHYKIWEKCYVLQALFEGGMLRAGNKGIGFGCGEGPLPSLFASMGIHVTATPLVLPQSSAGWMETEQSTHNIDKVWGSQLVAHEAFDQYVTLQYVDLTQIPPHFVGQYDYCWSSGMCGHVGDTEKGLECVETAMSVLKPGGIAVHTMLYMYDSDDMSGNVPRALFQEHHFEDVYERLVAEGHEVMPLDLTCGHDVLDACDNTSNVRYQNTPAHAHNKSAVRRFPCTCFGLIVRKAT